MLVSRLLAFLVLLAAAINGYSDAVDSTDPGIAISDSIYFNGEHEPISSSDFYGFPHNLPVTDTLTPFTYVADFPGSWMIIVIITGLLFSSIAWFHFSQRVRLALKAVIGLRFFFLVDKEETLFRETPTYLLFLNFLLIMALLIYQTLEQYNMLTDWVFMHQSVFYLLILGAFLLFYPVKALFVTFLSWIFNTRKATFLYLENIFVCNIFIGLVFLPLVFYNAFSPSPTVLHVMWGLLIAANLYKVIRGAYLAYLHSGFSVYYLFLYLCAVELAPLLIIGKALTTYLPTL